MLNPITMFRWAVGFIRRESIMVTQSDIPEPPDLSALYKDQAAIFESAIAQANDCYDQIRARDPITETLTANYVSEIEQVFLIAKAVQNPTMAIASVPVVLALANKTFAETPKAQAELTALFEVAVSAIDQI